MDLSPQQVRSALFKTVKRGYDPDEVDAFKETAAGAIESAQNQAMAMEARARAAVAKLQELSAQDAASAAPAQSTSSSSGVDTETISRTLLLAQRTADATVNEARNEAASITNGARTEAGSILDGARTMAGKLIDEAKIEARRAAETERVKAESEVQALLARRDFLLSDVDHLEQYIGAQRERLRDAAVSIHDLVDRVPGGLAEMRRPLLSASGEVDEPEDASPRLDLDDDPIARVSDPSPPPSSPASSTDSFVPTPSIMGEDPWMDDLHVPTSAPASTSGSSSTIEDVWRSLGDVDPVRPAQQHDSFDFGLDSPADFTSETPIVASQPSFDDDLDRDDLP